MGRNRKGLKFKKVLGLIMALIGTFIIIDVIPSYVWWVFLGIGLLFIGWLLYNS